MKILWLCNVIPPVIANQLNTETTVKEGWIDASLRRLLKDDNREIKLGICMPASSLDSPCKKDEVKVEGRQISLFRFLEQTEKPWVYDKTLETVFAGIIKEFDPDIIHIFGTEYPHARACVRAGENKEKILVGIQGVMSACARHYTGGLPEEIINKTTFRDWLKKDNIASQQRKFELRAGFEKEILEKVSHVTGRTAFDREEVLKINPDLDYHSMNETLRPQFYDGDWRPERLHDHGIFVSQADYPLKGFHVLLDAMPDILKEYPDAHINVAGNSITGYKTIKEKIKIGTYGDYLRKLIYKYDLNGKVTVLGKLDAQDMKKQYEDNSIYVCTSYIENSPNSMGEAMLVGIPCVVPETGGIPSMADKDCAVFYEPGNSKQLADSIIELFGNDKKALDLSGNAKKRAGINHDAVNNYKRLLEIYDKICQE